MIRFKWVVYDANEINRSLGIPLYDKDGIRTGQIVAVEVPMGGPLSSSDELAEDARPCKLV